jgi:hypothetical protein
MLIPGILRSQTNGGGMLEADKAKQLSGWFNVPVAADQVQLTLDSECQLPRQLRAALLKNIAAEITALQRPPVSHLSGWC